MLHLAFTERALLADEMGLGKTIQAIAACALLRRLGLASRVLVVTPASLKTEWEEQIQRFTDLPYQLVFGGRGPRLRAYAAAAATAGEGTPAPPFFTIVNYEQMLVDSLEVNQRLRPEIVVLDEAQRIKNWSTKTTQAVKRLRSRYAFILTGTPIENRIDELYSLMDFLNPSLLGPLFRFNRDYYALDDRGRPPATATSTSCTSASSPTCSAAAKPTWRPNCPSAPTAITSSRSAPSSRANTKATSESSPGWPASPNAARSPSRSRTSCCAISNMMRMVCDTDYILNPEHRACPKLAELEKLLEECRDNPEVKVIVFSEWERMLELARGLCDRLKLGFAWHTGTVPQKRRRAEINAFKSDPLCRVFLSTDSGAAGLNLQNASVVINCDLPWNPAKLEQRIARAWRKHQTRAVTVINLVSENTIEHRMLGTLSTNRPWPTACSTAWATSRRSSSRPAGRPSWPSSSNSSPRRPKAQSPSARSQTAAAGRPPARLRRCRPAAHQRRPAPLRGALPE